MAVKWTTYDFKGICPYCNHRLSCSKKDQEITCPACTQRICVNLWTNSFMTVQEAEMASEKKIQANKRALASAIAWLYFVLFLIIIPITLISCSDSSSFGWGLVSFFPALAVTLIIWFWLQKKWKKRNLILVYFVVQIILVKSMGALYDFDLLPNPIPVAVTQTAAPPEPEPTSTSDSSPDSTSASSVDTSTAPSASTDSDIPINEEYDPALEKEDRKQINKGLTELRRLGFIMKLEPRINTIYINPYQWLGLTYDEKEKMLQALSRYCEYYCEVIGPVVHLKDGYSGEELGSYSPFGAKVKS